MAAVGAGATGGFFVNTGSNTSRQRFSDGNVRYKAIFSREAFKKNLYEQKIHEHEYLTTRRRANLRREFLEEHDENKQKAKKIQPYGIIISAAGLLVSFCGFIEEWAATFPLGSLSGTMMSLKIIGVTALVAGIFLLSASHLIYHYNDTGSVRNPTINFKAISAREVKQRRLALDHKEVQLYYLSVAFRLAAVTLLVGFFGFCTGYIAEWGRTFPGGLTNSSKRIIGQMGIWGMILAVIVLIVTDTLIAYITEKMKQMVKKPQSQPPKKRYPKSLTIPTIIITESTAESQQEITSIEDVTDQQEFVDASDLALSNLQTKLEQARTNKHQDANYFDMPQSLSAEGIGETTKYCKTL